MACESLTKWPSTPVLKPLGYGSRIRAADSASLLRTTVRVRAERCLFPGFPCTRSRVEALHGRLTIESRLGAGTSVRAELPLATRGLGQ